MAFLMGHDVSQERLSSISPINYARSNFPPTLLMTGNQDAEVDWHDSLSMYLRLIEAGARCELHIFDGARTRSMRYPGTGDNASNLRPSFSEGTSRYQPHPSARR